MPELSDQDIPEVRRALSALAAEMAAEQAPPALEERLLQAFQARKGPVAALIARSNTPRGWLAATRLRFARCSLGARRAHRSRWPLWTALTAAAAAVAAIAIVKLDRPVEPLPPLRLVHAGPAPQWEQRQVQPSPVPPSKPALRQARRRPSSPVPVSDPAETEVASDFFALQPGPLVDVGEVVPMVRVRLPRYEMRRFGLPAGPEPWRTIQADVLLGQDGTARAIRFVSTRAQ
jgi:hypothetical protein